MTEKEEDYRKLTKKEEEAIPFIREIFMRAKRITIDQIALAIPFYIEDYTVMKVFFFHYDKVKPKNTRLIYDLDVITIKRKRLKKIKE